MIRKLLAAGLLGLTGLMLLPAAAQAHPLGDFTTNQYAGLRVTSTGVLIDHVLDLAELPAYQAQREEIDGDGDGVQTTAERDAYAARTCAAAGAASTVSVDGRPTRVVARPAELTFPPGAGGLSTLRLQCVLHAEARITGPATIGYRGELFANRIGWREVTAVGDRYTLVHSDVPAGSISDRLTGYPAGVTTSDVRSAALTVRPGGPPAPAAAAGLDARAGGIERFTTRFTDLVGRPELTLGVGILAFLLAIVLGGAHAVAPGHGKTIMAAYLIGSRGRLAQALTVAGTVAATHTVGVLALGVLLATSLQLAPDTMYEWLRLTSGVLVTLVGAHLLHGAVRALRARPAAGHSHPPATRDHTHDHLHDHSHDHTHDDSHQRERAHELVPAGPGDELGAVRAAPTRPGHLPTAGTGRTEPHVHHHGGRPHTHQLPDPDAPLRVRTLLAMGFAGGLSPSPSAVVVLLGAAALGRAWYGVLLVLAYGIGLAATLTGIGFALARWGDRLHRARSGRWSRLLMPRMPVATAAVIVAVGLGMVAFAAVSLVRL